MDDKDKILATTSELQKAVQEVFTPEFNKILIKYSIIRINTKFNIKYDLNRGFRGIMVEDMIADLMLSFVRNDGGRNWNKKEFPNFKNQIFSSLDSHIYNTIDKELVKTAQTNANIENNDVATENDGYEELLEFSTDYLTELGASDEEILLFEPYVVHKMKRADIAKEFGITEQEATNIKKKLDRKIPILREHLKKLER
jgi:Zn-dependent M16 (insulinase) family peptidase